MELLARTSQKITLILLYLNWGAIFQKDTKAQTCLNTICLALCKLLCLILKFFSEVIGFKYWPRTLCSETLLKNVGFASLKMMTILGF